MMLGKNLLTDFAAPKPAGGRRTQRLGFALRVLLAAGFLAALSPLAAAPDVPMVSGGLGPCTADFTVTDGSNKPLYNAKIHVTILYGFMNKRKQDLEVGTNSDGKARFEGLPDKLKKKPLEFQIRSGAQTKTEMQDPETNCHASFEVALASP